MYISKLTFTLLTLWIGMGTLTLQAQETVRRVTQAEAIKAATAKPQPEYPAMAQQLKIEGRVDLEVTISPAGSVDDVKIVSGNPVLTGAATNAVKRWRFEPFAADGKPVKAVVLMSFTFKR
jgi:protein TonB